MKKDKTSTGEFLPATTGFAQVEETEDYGREQAQPLMLETEFGVNYAADIVADRQVSFCSMQANTFQEKAMLFKAMNNPDKVLKDCVNMQIMLKDIYCETVVLQDENDGSLKSVPRIILIDTEGVAYSSCSFGVLGAVKKLKDTFGLPTYPDGLPIVVRQSSKKANRVVTTFDVVI